VAVLGAIEGALAPIAKSSPQKPPMSLEFYMPFGLSPFYQ